MSPLHANLRLLRLPVLFEEDELSSEERRSILKFDNKSQTILIVETKQDGAQPMSFGMADWSDARRDLGRSNPKDSKTIDFRFKKSFNALMADGSTRSFTHKNRKDIEEPHWTGVDFDSIR